MAKKAPAGKAYKFIDKIALQIGKAKIKVR